MGDFDRTTGGEGSRMGDSGICTMGVGTGGGGSEGSGTISVV